MNYRENMKKIINALSVAVILMMMSAITFAIDNPDAPDLVAEFEFREKLFIETAENPKNGYRDYLLSYTNYLEFLDKELNVVYQSLRENISEDQKQKLKESQVDWLKFRDREFSFIENTWTRADFGTSSSISRGQYKVTIVRNRVIQLMHYSITF